MRRLSDQFAEAAGSVSDIAQLRSILGDVVTELGFHHFALVDHSCTAAPRRDCLRIDNYPESWVEEWTSSGFLFDDPVHLASRRSAIGFSWGELDSLVPLEPRHRTILARSRHHGLGSGFTIPANIPGELSASCSFAVRNGCQIPAARLQCAGVIGAHALRAARRLRPLLPLPPRPRLSRREVQCLQLVAMGKTDWEIGRILGLSTETARQYVKRARAAYDAVSRTQLAVYGLRDAWISFEEAIPPDGGLG